VRSDNFFSSRCNSSVSFSTYCRSVSTSRPISSSFFSMSLRWI
jgi:hypothetical protein